jgi:putative oxidoreductase
MLDMDPQIQCNITSSMRRTLAENGVFLLRVSVSLLMLSHGVPKALEYEMLVKSFPDPLNVGTEMSANLILFAELGCSIFLLLGLFGRLASATLFIAMMVAAFVHHFGDPLATKELPLLYAAVYACLTFTGPGSTSIDAWLKRVVFEREEPASAGPQQAEPGAPT